MLLLLSFHALVAAVLAVFGRRVGRVVHAVAATPMAASVAYLASQWSATADGRVVHARLTWVPDLDVAVSLTVDRFSLLLGLVVSGIGVLVFAYAAGYFGTTTDRAFVARFASLIVAFGGAMLGLVLADDVWTLFVFWELTSVTSFLLIGLDDDVATARAAALRALLVTGAGGLALLGGLAIVAAEAGTTSLAGILATPATGTAFEVGLVLVLVGAFTKSAQWPFHFWLPGAMSAPTPVSAYLPSATMVKAGIVLVARFGPAFASLSWWRPLLVVVGTITMVLGGVRALRQHDAKLLLAHGTVSQLGLLMLLFGSGYHEATAAGVALLLAHALFKAALFLSVGIVDHATGTRDLRRLEGVGRSLPVVAVFAGVAAASMAGLPPLFGFAAKEAAVAALLHAEDGWATAALVGVAAGSVLTVAYSARFWFGVFGSGSAAPAAADRPAPATVHHRPSMALVAPVGVLTAATVAGGLAAGVVGHELAPSASVLDRASELHLALWPGFGLPLLISAVIVVVGLGVWSVGDRLAQVSTEGWPSGERAYQGALDGVMDGARRITGVVQSGSLPAYLAIVFAALVAAMIATLAAGASITEGRTVFAESPLQVAAASATAVAAVAVVAARQRFVAVVLLGLSGYGMAVLYLVQGAPDVALTQLLVETLVIVVFLLVLRHLPASYTPPPSWAPKALRLGLALAVGVSVAGFTWAASSARVERPVADAMVERSLPEAGGRNVVNVILVDFRGADTVGEITVLGIAAVGVANLVRSARSADRRGGRARAPAPTLAGGSPLGRRSVVLEVTVRLVFHLALVLSVYLTFRGHNAPGGGFAGGLVAGSAFVLRYLAGGRPEEARTSRLTATALIGTGLLVSVAMALAGLIGGDLLESGIAQPDLPLIGSVKLVSSTAFDVGVYLLVIGVVLSMIANLGSEPDAEDPTAAAPLEITR